MSIFEYELRFRYKNIISINVRFWIVERYTQYEREMGEDQIETSNKCNCSRDIKISVMQSEAKYGKCLQWNVERLIENWKLHRYK